MVASYPQSTLAGLVASLVDVDPAALAFKPVRTGKHNASFWVDSGRDRYVLRIAPPDDAGFLFYERLMMRQEPELHTLIRAHTDIPVAEHVYISRQHETPEYMNPSGSLVLVHSAKP